MVSTLHASLAGWLWLTIRDNNQQQWTNDNRVLRSIQGVGRTVLIKYMIIYKIYNHVCVGIYWRCSMVCSQIAGGFRINNDHFENVDMSIWQKHSFCHLVWSKWSPPCRVVLGVNGPVWGSPQTHKHTDFGRAWIQLRPQVCRLLVSRSAYWITLKSWRNASLLLEVNHWSWLCRNPFRSLQLSTKAAWHEMWLYLRSYGKSSPGHGHAKRKHGGPNKVMVLSMCRT